MKVFIRAIYNFRYYNVLNIMFLAKVFIFLFNFFLIIYLKQMDIPDKLIATIISSTMFISILLNYIYSYLLDKFEFIFISKIICSILFILTCLWFFTFERSVSIIIILLLSLLNPALFPIILKLGKLCIDNKDIKKFLFIENIISTSLVTIIPLFLSMIYKNKEVHKIYIFILCVILLLVILYIYINKYKLNAHQHNGKKYIWDFSYIIEIFKEIEILKYLKLGFFFNSIEAFFSFETTIFFLDKDTHSMLSVSMIPVVTSFGLFLGALVYKIQHNNLIFFNLYCYLFLAFCLFFAILMKNVFFIFLALLTLSAIRNFIQLAYWETRQISFSKQDYAKISSVMGIVFKSGAAIAILLSQYLKTVNSIYIYIIIILCLILTYEKPK